MKIPPHLRCAATLPCKMLMFANRCIPSSRWWFRSACQSRDALTYYSLILAWKINGCYYRELLLSQQLLPAIRQVSGDFFMFQQDSARETIKLLQWETPAFISRDLWHPNSPDLNPRFGEWCKIGSTRKKWRTWTSWESDCLRSGPDCNRTWLTMPSTSGANACMPPFGLEEDILSICCDCISYLGYGSWSSLKIFR